MTSDSLSPTTPVPEVPDTSAPPAPPVAHAAGFVPDEAATQQPDPSQSPAPRAADATPAIAPHAEPHGAEHAVFGGFAARPDRPPRVEAPRSEAPVSAAAIPTIPAQAPAATDSAPVSAQQDTPPAAPTPAERPPRPPRHEHPRHHRPVAEPVGNDEISLASMGVEHGELELSRFDPDALKVVTRLRQYGHEAYFVGGCVRDLMLGRTPKDFDIATSATPNEVRGIFRNCRLIGRRFRLAHVYFKGGKIVEVSTFRANPAELTEPEPAVDPEAAEPTDATDGERPEDEDLLITHDNVFGTAEEDARRRDFTMNGLFYDVGEGKVIDYVRGRRDVERRQIRTIGDPERRLREDPVRLLRAVRFACKLQLDIESRTYAAMEGAVEDLPRCAPPRLLEETFRLIRGGIAAPSIRLISALGALKILLPPIHDFLEERGKEGEKTFYAFAEALDRKVQSSREPLEDAILLAALLLPISRAAPGAPAGAVVDENAPPSVPPSIEHLLNELVRTARLPRRIAERCRMILFAQKTLSGERRRRGPLGQFRKHPLYAESLVVFELSVEATGEGREALEAWKAGAAPEVKPDADGPKGRRRRRRRRGPRAPGEPSDAGASGGSEGGSESGSDSGSDGGSDAGSDED